MHHPSFSRFVKQPASASPLRKGVLTALILLTLSLLFTASTLIPFSVPVSNAAVITKQCGFGTRISNGQCRGYLTTTGAGTWTVPFDWNNSSNTVEVIGAGGGGSNGVNARGAGGGGYSKTSNITLSGSVAFNVGAHGNGGAASVSGNSFIGVTGGNTYFCNSTSNCASIAGTAVKVGANGGVRGTNSPGAGGSTTGAVGDTKFAGGSGGATSGFGGSSGGGICWSQRCRKKRRRSLWIWWWWWWWKRQWKRGL